MLSHLAGVFAESPILQVVWGCAVAGSVKGLALLGLAWVVLKLCSGPSSELRHRIWFLVLLGSLVFPIAWVLTPIGLKVPVAAAGSLASLVGMLPFAGRSEFLQVMCVPGTGSVVTGPAVRVLRRLLPFGVKSVVYTQT